MAASREVEQVIERVADWLNAFKADPFSTGADKAERCIEVVSEALSLSRIEPTEAMIEAGLKALWDERPENEKVRAIYLAMHTLSPTPDSGRVSGSHASHEACSLRPSGFDPAREEDVAIYRAIAALYEVAMSLHEFSRVYRGSGKDGHIWQRIHVINERAWSAVVGLNHFLTRNQNLACPRCVRRADQETLAKWGPEVFAVLRPNAAPVGDESSSEGEVK